MMKTEKHASWKMVIFLSIILIAALGIGAIYFYILTPGNPGSSTLQRPQDGTLQQHTR